MTHDRSPLANDRLIAQLPVPSSGQKIIYDRTVPGFGVRLTAGGAKTFILNYRVRGTGRERRFSIGSADRCKVAAARKEAERLRRIVDLGGDPMGDLENARAQAEIDRRRAKTMKDLADRFLEEHVPTLRPASQQFYRLALKNHIVPAMGRKRVGDVERADIERLHRDLTARGMRHAANQAVILSGVLFKFALKWGWRQGDNPARGVDKNTLEGRERYLSPAETKRLAAAIDQLEDRQAAAILRVLLLTGSRVGETLRMTWDQIDFERALWTKPAATTKQKRMHRLPLTAPVLEVLNGIWREEVRRRGGAEPRPADWVFPGRSDAGHRADIRLSWEVAKKSAAIDSLRIHDLRHSMASTLVGAGYSLPTIGAALGHSRTETTARYAHLADDPLRQAMTRAADIIEAARKAEPADVIRMPPKGKSG